MFSSNKNWFLQIATVLCSTTWQNQWSSSDKATRFWHATASKLQLSLVIRRSTERKLNQFDKKWAAGEHTVILLKRHLLLKQWSPETIRPSKLSAGQESRAWNSSQVRTDIFLSFNHWFLVRTKRPLTLLQKITHILAGVSAMFQFNLSGVFGTGNWLFLFSSKQPMGVSHTVDSVGFIHSKIFWQGQCWNDQKSLWNENFVCFWFRLKFWPFLTSNGVQFAGSDCVPFS